MSEIMMNVPDWTRALHTKIHGNCIDYLVAALSGDPETIEGPGAPTWHASWATLAAASTAKRRPGMTRRCRSEYVGHAEKRDPQRKSWAFSAFLLS